MVGTWTKSLPYCTKIQDWGYPTEAVVKSRQACFVFVFCLLVGWKIQIFDITVQSPYWCPFIMFHSHRALTWINRFVSKTALAVMGKIIFLFYMLLPGIRRIFLYFLMGTRTFHQSVVTAKNISGNYDTVLTVALLCLPVVWRTSAIELHLDNTSMTVTELFKKRVWIAGDDDDV